MTETRPGRWTLNPLTYIWATWTGIRASFDYVNGRIDGDEWHARIGIARVAIGRDEPDLGELENQA